MKNLKALIILISAFSGINSLVAKEAQITIFVHGTRELSKLFISYTNQNDKIANINTIPNTCATHSISNTLDDADSNNFGKEHFYVFGWSGKLKHQERFNAAKILYEEIIKLIDDLKKQNIEPVINLITHSHGGNVALNLANFVNENEEPKFKINNLILLACPVQNQTNKLISSDLFQNVYSLYSDIDFMQVLDPQGLHPENKNQSVPLFSRRQFAPCPNLKQVKITINNIGISHIKFLKPRFFKRLPKLLQTIDSIDNNSLIIDI